MQTPLPTGSDNLSASADWNFQTQNKAGPPQSQRERKKLHFKWISEIKTNARVIPTGLYHVPVIFLGKEGAALEQVLFIIIDEYSQEKQRMLLNGLI